MRCLLAQSTCSIRVRAHRIQYNVRNADGAIGGNPAIRPFLQLTNRRLPLPSEQGWKDTVITYPGEVTRIAVRWAPTDIAVPGRTDVRDKLI